MVTEHYNLSACMRTTDARSFVQDDSNSSVEGQRTVARFTLRSFCCSFVRFIVFACSTLPFI